MFIAVAEVEPRSVYQRATPLRISVMPISTRRAPLGTLPAVSPKRTTTGAAEPLYFVPDNAGEPCPRTTTPPVPASVLTAESSVPGMTEASDHDQARVGHRHRQRGRRGSRGRGGGTRPTAGQRPDRAAPPKSKACPTAMATRRLPQRPTCGMRRLHSPRDRPDSRVDSRRDRHLNQNRLAGHGRHAGQVRPAVHRGLSRVSNPRIGKQGNKERRAVGQECVEAVVAHDHCASNPHHGALTTMYVPNHDSCMPPNWVERTRVHAAQSISPRARPRGRSFQSRVSGHDNPQETREGKQQQRGLWLLRRRCPNAENTGRGISSGKENTPCPFGQGVRVVRSQRGRLGQARREMSVTEISGDGAQRPDRRGPGGRAKRGSG